MTAAERDPYAVIEEMRRKDKPAHYNWGHYADALEAALRDRDRRIEELEEQVRGWEGYKRGIDEALNSGDGSYRP